MEQNKVTSPALAYVKLTQSQGIARLWKNNEEKDIWKDENTSNEWKQNNLSELKSRFSDWQLKAFEESINLKLKQVYLLLKKISRKS